MDRESLRNQAASRRNKVGAETPTKKAMWNCEFCSHDFLSERVFMKHMCKERIRIEELRGPIGQSAYSYYADWMRLNKRSVPPIETFASSMNYNSFIKFAKHVRKVNMPNPSGFVKTMVEHGNIQPVLWCRDNVYAMYLQGYDKIVSPTVQFINSVDVIMEYAKDYECLPKQVFEQIGIEKILDLVQKRKLSPWFLVSSGAFRAYMASRNEIETDRLESGVQVGAMIMRIQQTTENTELFSEFAKATRELDL